MKLIICVANADEKTQNLGRLFLDLPTVEPPT